MLWCSGAVSCASGRASVVKENDAMPIVMLRLSKSVLTDSQTGLEKIFKKSVVYLCGSTTLPVAGSGWSARFS